MYTCFSVAKDTHSRKGGKRGFPPQFLTLDEIHAMCDPNKVKHVLNPLTLMVRLNWFFKGLKGLYHRLDHAYNSALRRIYQKQTIP